VATTKVYESPDGLLRFLVVQDDGGDVSLGFDEYAWHTHGDVLAATVAGQTVACFWASCSPESGAGHVTEHTEQSVHDLLAGNPIIAIEKVSGNVRDIWITDDPATDARRCLPDETIEFRRWDGTVIPIRGP
jgi:hypothetical protein